MLQAGSGANGRPPARELEVIIIGAGFGGIAAAIELRRHGIRSVRLLEKASDLGRHLVLQQLPGLRLRRPQPPVLVLLRAAQGLVAAVLPAGGDPLLPARRRPRPRHRAADQDEHLRQQLLLGRAALPLDGPRQRGQHLRVRRDRDRHRPARPALDPRPAGRGELRRARLPLGRMGPRTTTSTGKRVAVVGNGASAVQFVPEIAPRVGRLSVFQRTGNWFLPRKNLPSIRAWMKAAFERVPGLQAWRRIFLFCYTESLTLCIRNPRTFGRLMALRSAALHALAAVRPRGAPQSLAGLHLRVQADPLQLRLPAGPAAPQRRARDGADRARGAARA